jgi:sugar phosphate isomerase/epimerase
VPENLDAVHQMAEIAHRLGSPYLRMGMTDVEWVQQACDIADEAGVSVVVQIHTNTPLETVEGALRVCGQVDRDNFGLTYEPANFILAGREYGVGALKQIAGKLFNVTLQNLKPVEQAEGEGVIVYNDRGFIRCLPGDPDGVDFDAVFSGLNEINYNGYATVIDPIHPELDSMELARIYLEKLAPLC